ncbi:MAG: glycosyltransferase family 9 protein, partial [Nitrospinota bacterium]
MKTVLFGPFIGELGWELMWWQGWVRKVCQTTYAGCHRIAVSTPGREPFYPYVDEFWPLPDHIQKRLRSQRNYITDYWRNGLPQAGGFPIKKLLLNLRLQRKEVSETALPDLEPDIAALIASYRKRVPGELVVHCPCYLNHFAPDGLTFGVSCPEKPRSERSIRPHKIPLAQQLLEPIQPTARGLEELDRLASPQERLIAVFPRNRTMRRSDKNWPREKYDRLIRALQTRYPDHRVAILGDPVGAHYADGVPEGCLDLINCAPQVRLDLQVAALSRCGLALGSFSGAILLALACRCPAVTWGYQNVAKLYHDETYLNTSFVYYPFMESSVE